MKNLFIGLANLNASPCIVNREIVKYLPETRYNRIIKGKGLGRRLRSYYKIITSRKIIISGIFVSASEVRLMRLFRKKFIYLMHGSFYMETGMHSKTEDLIHKYATKIVSVSRLHAQMIREEFPQYAEKVVEWFNGVDWDQIESFNKENSPRIRDPKKIILFGGGRFMKGNLLVCKSVEMLNSTKNSGLHIDVYGELRDDDCSQAIKNIPCVNFKPLIPQAEVNRELMASNLFIANSSFDTFNLSVLDAIGFGCNVLFSRFVGSKDIIPGKNNDDIINNPEDIREIKDKIEKVLGSPNNSRLYNSIDRTATSWKTRTAQLEKIVDSLT